MTVSQSDGITTVFLDGSIDGKTAPLIREELRPVLETAEKVILDLTAVVYLSSAGLRLLLLVYREFAARKRSLVLLGISEDIRKVMEHTGFLSFFKIATSSEEAVKLLG